MNTFRTFLHVGLVVVAVGSITLPVVAQPLYAPDHEQFTQEAAERMRGAREGVLAPVYAPLAEQIVADYGLDALEKGIGVDLGAGPGALIFELVARTNLHWVNAEINPHYFAKFFADAEAKGIGHRVSAIFADGQALPFRDNYADVLVSRGTYHFIEDRTRAFGEIYRVLKPGGVAYVGRGFARDMSVEIARDIREQQGRSMVYDREEAARELETIMDELGIDTFSIEIPVPEQDESLNYGIWIEIRKPLGE